MLSIMLVIMTMSIPGIMYLAIEAATMAASEAV
jgi:hypothetical protein